MYRSICLYAFFITVRNFYGVYGNCIKIGIYTQKIFHSRYNFGYGILLYMRKMPLFHPKTAYFGGCKGVFSFVTDKSAILCPANTEVADFVSFKE